MAQEPYGWTSVSRGIVPLVTNVPDYGSGQRWLADLTYWVGPFRITYVCNPNSAPLRDRRERRASRR